MSTFNQPTNLGPQRIEPQEEVSSEPQGTKDRPSPEKVTPSQQGKFLSELEKKEREKEIKSASGKSSEEEAAEATEKGLFALAGKVKARKSLGEKGSQNGGEQQTAFSLAAQQAALQQQAALSQKSAEPDVSRIASSKQVIGGESLEKKERVAFRSPSDEEASKAPQAPIIAPQPEITVTAGQQGVEEAKASREALLELFKQAVDALTTMVSKAETTTVVTIKHPPIFEGATLLLTQYSTAPKQYNIAFGNLSPDARRLLETTGCEERLRQALVDKGYTLHIMTLESKPLEVTTPTRPETATPEDQRGGRSFEGREKEEKERK